MKDGKLRFYYVEANSGRLLFCSAEVESLPGLMHGTHLTKIFRELERLDVKAMPKGKRLL